MKKVLLFLIFILKIYEVYPQENSLYQTGLTAEQNLKAIGSLALYTTGGVGYDTRYEGLKGSPALFDTLLPSFLKVKGQDYYIQLKANIDLIHSSLIFIHPKTGKLLVLPSDIIIELKIDTGGSAMVFRITKARFFEKDIKDGKFYQVLKDGKIQFIKIPVKKLIAADYKDVYSADRRYDEYTTYYKYFIMNTDSTFHQIQLTKRSLIKAFPEWKELISNSPEEKSFANKEEMVMSILEKF